MDINMEYGWFYENFVNTKHRVIGIELKPFSTHHVIHLKSIDSPLLKVNGNANILDLLKACLICSTSYGDDVSGLINEYLKKQNVKPCLNIWPFETHTKKLYKKCIKPDFLKECFDSFSSYMHDYCAVPPTIEMFGKSEVEPQTQTDYRSKDFVPNFPKPPDIKNSPSIPPLITSTVLLMSKLGMTEEQAMNLSLGKVHTYVHTYIFQETGKTKILGQVDFIALKLCSGEIDPSTISFH